MKFSSHFILMLLLSTPYLSVAHAKGVKRNNKNKSRNLVSNRIYEFIVIILLMIIFLTAMFKEDTSLNNIENSFGSDLACFKKIKTCRKLFLNSHKNEMKLKDQLQNMKDKVKNIFG